MTNPKFGNFPGKSQVERYVWTFSTHEGIFFFMGAISWINFLCIYTLLLIDAASNLAVFKSYQSAVVTFSLGFCGFENMMFLIECHILCFINRFRFSKCRVRLLFLFGCVFHMDYWPYIKNNTLFCPLHAHQSYLNFLNYTINDCNNF